MSGDSMVTVTGEAEHKHKRQLTNTGLFFIYVFGFALGGFVGWLVGWCLGRIQW